MTTRPYSEVLAETAALAGCSFAAQEEARVKIFLNRRARKAYAECEYWPRFYKVGEERVVSEDGLLPFEQDDLSTIGTVLRIHVREPFKEYAPSDYEFHVESGGIQIHGYCPVETDGDFGITISGTLNPDITGTIEPSGTYPFNGPDGVERSYYSTNGNTDAPASGSWWMVYYSGSGKWTITYWSDGVNTAVWESAEGTALTPGLAEDWAALVGDGTPVVEDVVNYIAFITYKAALPDTYGDGADEEDEVPEEFASYMAQGAYADFLRSDGQTDKALVEEAIAAELLEQQLSKVSRQNGQSVHTRILTHSNTQAR